MLEHHSIRSIKGPRLAFAALCLLPAAVLTAGEPKEVVIYPEDPNPVVDIAFYMPGWLQSIDGTTGVKGLSSNVDAEFNDIVQNLDMIAAAGLEVRRGKLGFILEGIYAELSVGGSPPGPLLSNISVGMQQVLAEGTMTYRLLDGERGWLEFLAGARYVYLDNELTLTVDPEGVAETSAELSSAVVDRATAAAREEVASRLPGIVAQLQDKAADLRAQVVNEITGRVDARVDSVRGRIQERLDQGIGSRLPGDRGPNLGEKIASSGRVRNAMRDYVEAKVSAQLEEARARASAAVAQARASARQAADRKLARAEAKLTEAIEDEINETIPSSPVSASKGWVDPFVGFRGAYRLTDRCSLIGRGDIGGFGVSSDLTWNLFGAVGYQFNPRMGMELGYRYLSIDYQSGGFTYDMVMKGPYLGLRLEF